MSLHLRSKSEEREMFSPSCLVVFISLIYFSSGFNWAPISTGESLPKSAVPIEEGVKKYIGRARHYDELLPAVIENGKAVVKSCGKEIIKNNFEVLACEIHCEWKHFFDFPNLPLNILIAGNRNDNEPIYIGKRSGTQDIIPIYVSSLSKMQRRVYTNFEVMVCSNGNFWVDTHASKLPNNTLIREKCNGSFVARLKSGCSIIPGEVRPKLKLASAFNNDEEIKSEYCQVLTGDEKEYDWMSASRGYIPDYAVVASRTPTGELMYVAKWNSTQAYITHTMGLNSNATYEVLVRKHRYYLHSPSE